MKQVELVETTDTHYKISLNNKTITYPRVTSIIGSAGLTNLQYVKREVLEANAKFGKFVHKACYLWDKNELKESTLDQDLIPYLNGWKLFRREVKWAKTILMNEQLVYSHKWGYAGTEDRLFAKGYLVDIKTGLSVYPPAGLQLSAYAEAIKEMTRIVVKSRFVVQLKPDGYVLHEFSDLKDLGRFFACLTIFNAKKEWKL